MSGLKYPRSNPFPKRYNFQTKSQHLIAPLLQSDKARSNFEFISEKIQKPWAVEQDRRDLPKIALISTGGTIASKIDYRTGGVKSALSAVELYESVPELAKYAIIEPEVLLSEYSENLKPQHWGLIAKRIYEILRSDDYRGIIISHGTDTMHYTASALQLCYAKYSCSSCIGWSPEIF